MQVFKLLSALVIYPPEFHLLKTHVPQKTYATIWSTACTVKYVEVEKPSSGLRKGYVFPLAEACSNCEHEETLPYGGKYGDPSIER